MIRIMPFCFAIAISIISSISQAQTARVNCASGCAFSFCRSLKFVRYKVEDGHRLNFFGNNSPHGGFLCRRRLLQDVQFGEATVFPSALSANHTAVRISAYRPPGLHPPFSPRYFRTFPGTTEPKFGKLLHLTRRSKGNQDLFLNDLCVRIPILRYQERKRSGAGKIGKTASKPSDCISFRAVTHKAIIQLSWNTSDDLDLSLRLPTGEEVSRFSPRANNGARFVFDLASAVPCLPFHTILFHENVIFRRTHDLMDGEYVAVIEHYRNCNRGSTQYSLHVFLDGIKKYSVTGTTNLRNREIADEIRFSIRGGKVLAP